MSGASERRSTSATGIALGTIVSASAAPYGYTVTLWSSGALLMHFRSSPSVGDIMLFAAGALAGFTLLGLRARPALQSADPMERPVERVLAGALHWFSVGVALGVVALVAQISSWVAWPLGSLAATTLFLLCSSLQLAIVTRVSAR